MHDQLSLKAVLQGAAAYDRISVAELAGRDQSRRMSRARQRAIYLARQLTGRSFPQIGRAFGRHHTAMLYAVRQVKTRLAVDANEREQIGSLLRHLGGPPL